jgi:type IV secretory pathway VirB10-like protein
MAKARGRKLKVFQAQFGFHDSVVAAPSQAAALRAWGTRQNLFAEGQARLADDPQAVEAARAHPEVPLRRAVGSNDPFELEPTALPKVPDRPKPTVVKAAPTPKPVPTRPPADRSALDAAEAALHSVDERRKREEARLRDEQAELERKIAERQATYVAARKEGGEA